MGLMASLRRLIRDLGNPKPPSRFAAWRLRLEKLEGRQLLAVDFGPLASDFLDEHHTEHEEHADHDDEDHVHDRDFEGFAESAQRNDLDGTGGNNELNVNPSRAISERVTIQPIVARNNDGSNQAGYFGTATQQAAIEDLIDTIWAQAGIDIDWLAPRFWNNTFANVGTQNPRPTDDLETVGNTGDAAGVGNSDPLILDMYFVEVSAGFGPRDSNVANGLAWVGANGITIHIGEDLVSWSGGQEVVARVTAHEIGHNLGLPHVSATGNLMTPSSGSELLNNSQISTALASQFSVPLPSNNAPTVAAPLPDVVLQTDDAPSQISIANVFNDVDGDDLSYQVSTTNPAVNASLNGTTLTLSVNTTVAAATVVNVTASDGRGGTVTDSFLVNITVPPPAATDWGVVDFLSRPNQSISGIQWFELQTTRAGLLTTIGEWTQAANAVELAVFDSTVTEVQAGTVAGNSVRADVAVQPGETYYLRVTGNGTVALKAANLVSFSGSSVTAFGTNTQDVLSFAVGNSHSLTINDVPYAFPSATYTNFQIDTLLGEDRTTILDGAQAETFTARPLQATFAANSGQYSVTINGSENVIANSIAGGQDFAEFFDAAGADHFYAAPDVAFLYSLSGAFNNSALGFETTRAWKTNTGNDVAIFVDSAGNDSFLATPSSAKLTGPNSSFINEAVGFLTVHSYANAGGSDSAQLFDSVANDTFYGDDTQAFLQNDTFVAFAGTYEDVQAFSTAGGNDTAILFDSAGNDTYESFPTRALMRSNTGSFQLQADSFEATYGYSRRGGFDTATLNGSTGREEFTGSPEFSRLAGVDAVFNNYATDFESVTANGGGGNDLASLFDSTGNDLATVAESGTTLSLPTSQIVVQAFPTVYATSSRGGVDQVSESVVSYTFLAVGPWI